MLKTDNSDSLANLLAAAKEIMTQDPETVWRCIGGQLHDTASDVGMVTKNPEATDSEGRRKLSRQCGVQVLVAALITYAEHGDTASPGAKVMEALNRLNDQVTAALLHKETDADVG